MPSQPDEPNRFNKTLQDYRRSYHSQCLFQNAPPVETLHFHFTDDGILKGEFVCSEEHQGYDRIVHGGIIAAVIDASMAQCCMGHGIAAYTAELSIRYRAPIKILTPTTLETRIVGNAMGVLFSLQCRIKQETHDCADATGRFFKMTSHMGQNERRNGA